MLHGDFNTIFGGREYSGSHQSTRTPMDDFSNWSNSNHILHLPTTWAKFIWNNGRREGVNNKKILYWSICNHKWIDACTKISCPTLIKTNSYHYLFLLVFDYNDTWFISQFRFLQVWSKHLECLDVIEFRGVHEPVWVRFGQTQYPIHLWHSGLGDVK